MPWITKEGRTVDEARDAAIAAAGMSVDELDVEVVNEGAKGLFGLGGGPPAGRGRAKEGVKGLFGLGGEPAVVRVRPKEKATDFRHAFRDDITPARDDEEPDTWT